MSSVPEAGINEEELNALIKKAIAAHPDAVLDYPKNPKAANVIIGEVMKLSKGRYPSKDVSEKVKNELEKI